MLLALFVPRALAQAPITPPEAPKLAPVAPLSIDEMIDLSAEKYDVDANIMRRIIQCESMGNPSAVGDSGRSFGVAQIFLPVHPDITKEQALDPKWSIELMAKEFSVGHASWWTCWRMLYE